MNIYVGNIPHVMSEDDLRQTFQEFGEVDTVNVIKDNLTGRSRGFGFVEMPNQEEGNAAISALNGKEVRGRVLTVNEARPRPEGSRQGAGGGGRHGGRGGGARY